MISKTKPNELKISRVYDAPLQAVWDAWTDVEQVAQWWGPRGFSITTHSKDLRPGGAWVYTMHGPDGVDYPNITYYHEVIERESLVYDHGASEGKPPLFRVSVRFQALGDQTSMEMTMTLATPEQAKQTAKFVKQAGGNATWDRLAEYLEKNVSGKDVFVINRSFDAPLERVFAMWTDPSQLAQWLPPAGMQMELQRGEITPEASTLWRMYGPDFEFYFRFDYRKIAPDRIVYIQQFCDSEGRVSRHPMAPLWPETMLTTVTMEPESEGFTRVTVVTEPYGPITQDERDAFNQERGGMTKGWTGSFDKLEDRLPLL